MKIATVHDPIEADGLGDGNIFTIAANPKAFAVLSQKIYADPITAVIREITCNAADAHALTGRSVADIEVHLPNVLEPEFWVRDYGPGLSIKDVRGLYTTYFASTKDQTDDFVGGFGIGSKSPFAVSDQFTVTSWHGGFCSEFVCYKENGAPRINLIRSTPSSEPTGLRVQVAVSDRPHLWADAADRFFRYWPVIPTTLASRIKPIFPNLAYKSAHNEGLLARWYALPATPKSRVLMGGVCYEIDNTHVPFLSKISDWRSFHSLLLVAPLGAVSPQPSREQLNYDTDTIAWLTNAAEAAVNELHSSLINSVTSAASLYEARKLAHEATENVPFLHLARSRLQYNGNPIPHTTYFEVPQSTTINVGCYSRNSYQVTWRTHGGQVMHRWDKDANQHYLYLSAPPTSATYKRIRLKHPTKSGQTYYLFWGDTEANIQAALDAQGFPPNCLQPFDNVVPIPAPTVRKPRTTTSTVRDLTGYPLYSTSRCSFVDTQVPLDLSVPAYWIETFAGHIQDTSLAELCSFFQQHTTVPIVKINGSNLTDRALKALATNGWTQITHDILRNLDNSILDQFITRHLIQTYDNIDFRLQRHYRPALPSTSKLRQALDALANATALPSPTIVASNTFSLLPYKAHFTNAQWDYICVKQAEYIQLKDNVVAELDKFPLYPHLQLTNKVVPAILDYLSK